MYFPRDIFQKFILEYMYCYNFLRLSWGHGWTWKAYFSTNIFLAHKYFNFNFDFETVSHIWFSILLDLEGWKNSMPHPLLHNGTIQLICISFYHNNRRRISWKCKYVHEIRNATSEIYFNPQGEVYTTLLHQEADGACLPILQ